jgi:hypothetical protein
MTGGWSGGWWVGAFFKIPFEQNARAFCCSLRASADVFLFLATPSVLIERNACAG